MIDSQYWVLSLNGDGQCGIDDTLPYITKQRKTYHFETNSIEINKMFAMSNGGHSFWLSRDKKVYFNGTER